MVITEEKCVNLITQFRSSITAASHDTYNQREREGHKKEELVAGKKSLNKLT